VNKAHLLCRHFALVYGRFRHADTATQSRVVELARVVNEGATADERQAATVALAETIFPGQLHEEPDELAEEATFGRRVAAVLKDRGWTYDDLGFLLGVAKSTVSVLVSRRNRPRYRTVKKIACALGMPPEELWPAERP
jgi:lambda repressor-like predicted transcriptional regulator